MPAHPHEQTCRPIRRLRALAAAAAVAAATAALSACAASAVTFESQLPPPSPSEMVAEGSGSGADVPAPGSTVAPVAPTDAGIPAGLTLAVVAPDSTPDTTAARRAVDALADDLGATVTHVGAVPQGTDDPETLLQAALDAGPDVVVVLGPALLDALDRVSASTLDQQFLTLGTRLPEPTANVTAVVWPGVEDVPQDGPVEVAPRAREALAAGLAAMTTGGSGYVVALP